TQPARQHHDHERIEDEQRERGEKDWPAQIERFAVAVDISARIQRRRVERSRSVRRYECVDGDKTFWRTVEARRMIEAAASGEVARNRTGGRRWSGECTETVEYSCRWNDLGGPATRVFCRGVVAFGGPQRTLAAHEAPKHVHDGARQRQI